LDMFDYNAVLRKRVRRFYLEWHDSLLLPSHFGKQAHV
jgi:hypothetical protein